MSAESSRDSCEPTSPGRTEDGGPPRSEYVVAVLGNPNAGKTTVFNRLTGLSQKVGNYPGVTVEKKEGLVHAGGIRIRLVDLPGTYSLAANSPDEMVAVDVLLGDQRGAVRPDLVLLVVDASNLERNLYLFSQVRELGVPVVIGLNMVDVARKRGVEFDLGSLSARLGAPVVALEGHRGVGFTALREALMQALTASETHRDAPPPEVPVVSIPDAFARQVESFRTLAGGEFRRGAGRELGRFEVLRALVDTGGLAEERLLHVVGEGFRAGLEAARSAADGHAPLAAQEAQARYAWVRERVAGCGSERRAGGPSFSERLDRVLTHRVFGLVIFAAMMLVVFQAIFSWAQPVMDAVDSTFAALGQWIGAMLPDGVLRSLVVDGLVAGVGAVVVFVPQILILFFFIGLLEDCGYMARAAFLMDRIMAKCGLSGKSFIPMLSGFACAVPGIMAARVIENRRDRIATVLVTPLMSCSARLPVYAILIATFIPGTPVLGGLLNLQALVLFGLYALGITAAIVMAWVFKHTILRGAAPPFVLELPDYKRPSLQGVLLRLFDRGKAFLVRAGTIILAITVVIWALAYFPHPAGISEEFAQRRVAAQAERQVVAALDREEAGAYLRQSYFGRLGRLVEPLFRPLGWDWKISMAAIASFPAREVVVATLGTIYNLGSDEGEEASRNLGQRLRAERWEGTDVPVFTVPVALSIMVFFALCCQCGATLATIRRETNAWRWAFLTFGYMSVLAYAAGAATYQIGSAL